jgi:hypothetical protein
MLQQARHCYSRLSSTRQRRRPQRQQVHCLRSGGREHAPLGMSRHERGSYRQRGAVRTARQWLSLCATYGGDAGGGGGGDEEEEGGQTKAEGMRVPLRCPRAPRVPSLLECRLRLSTKQYYGSLTAPGGGGPAAVLHRYTVTAGAPDSGEDRAGLWQRQQMQCRRSGGREHAPLGMSRHERKTTFMPCRIICSSVQTKTRFCHPCCSALMGR